MKMEVIKTGVVLVLMTMQIITMRIKERIRITQQKTKMKIIAPMKKIKIKLQQLLTKLTTIRETALIQLRIIHLKPLIIQIGNRI